MAMCMAVVVLAATTAPEACPWLDATMPIPQRVSLLMKVSERGLTTTGTSSYARCTHNAFAWSRLFELLRHQQNVSYAIGFLLHLVQEMTMVEKAGQLEHSSLPFDPNDPATQQWIAAGGFGAMTIEVSVVLACVALVEQLMVHGPRQSASLALSQWASGCTETLVMSPCLLK
jgi:hypothetical protein